MSASSTSTDLPEPLQSTFDLGIWHILSTWPALTLSIQNQWGGPASSDKRDWLAGQISLLFSSDPLTEAEDIEVLLLQVLEDEFGVRLEDETEVGVAKQILHVRREVEKGDTASVDKLQAKWLERRGREADVGMVSVGRVQEEEEDSGDEGSGSEEDEDEDVEMDEAPALVEVKAKPVVEVDEEGFTKVVGRRKR